MVQLRFLNKMSKKMLTLNNDKKILFTYFLFKINHASFKQFEFEDLLKCVSFLRGNVNSD